MIAAFIGEKDSLNHSYLVYFVHYRRKREFYAIYVFLCLAAILKKHKEKGKEVLKNEKKKAHQQEEREKRQIKKSEVLASFVSMCKVVLFLA